MLGHQYVVRKGDCLWNIAKQHLGSGQQWPRIWKYNNREDVIRVTGRGIKNPDLIFPGQILLIPHVPGARKATGPSSAKPASPQGSLSPHGPLSSHLSAVQSPISVKFRLDDIKFPPLAQPGMILEIKMSGDIVMMSKKKYPALYVTQRRELELQAVQSANAALSTLVTDTRLIYDSKENKLTYRSMLVTQSGGSNAWATAVGVQADSSSPIPKLRFEFRVPKLQGSLTEYLYTALGVTIIVELTPKPDQAPLARDPRPAPSLAPSTNWGRVFGTGLVIVAGAIVVGTIIEDFLTLGVGTADDLASFAAAGSLFTAGVRMMNALPATAIPASVTMNVSLLPQ